MAIIRVVQTTTPQEAPDLLTTLIERSMELASEVHEIDLKVRKILAEKVIQEYVPPSQRREGVKRRGIRVERGLD